MSYILLQLVRLFVVFSSECVKFLVTLVFVYTGSGSIRKGNELIKFEFILKPYELIKMSVPSLAYAIQNNLDFVALSNLDASVYQVFNQLKIPFTAVFMMLFLRRQFSLRRWFSIFQLCIGLALVELDISKVYKNSQKEENNLNKFEDETEKNQFIGLLAIFGACIFSSFAGVYFEKMLKDGSSNTPFWIRNLQMYSCGVISAFLGCLIKDYNQIIERGFLFGYNTKVVCIIRMLSLGGIYISLIMKHLDNLYKSFASSLSIIMVVIFSLFIFDGYNITFLFGLGALLVCLSVIFYNSAEH
ncbi:hypothetical protein Mgra_00001122 [Meloidogyne graminicola]|uniref:UDP-galactose transporter n=1 Tax=Meloidogyne graminicola TaxID=189291 RepID=A0A8T0A2C0_9BILA|nr:hypothetical protein Mgra_00001122 [Meloidogyne graminicola]